MSLLSRTQMTAKTDDPGQKRSTLNSPTSRRVGLFVRHLVEMIVAMMIGMAALGAVWRAILAACGADAQRSASTTLRLSRS